MSGELYPRKHERSHYPQKQCKIYRPKERATSPHYFPSPLTTQNHTPLIGPHLPPDEASRRALQLPLLALRLLLGQPLLIRDILLHVHPGLLECHRFRVCVHDAGCDAAHRTDGWDTKDCVLRGDEGNGSEYLEVYTLVEWKMTSKAKRRESRRRRTVTVRKGDEPSVLITGLRRGNLR